MYRMRLRPVVVSGAIAAVALLAAACGPTPPPKGDFAGPSYSGTADVNDPTGFKDESKLWHHDGTWWSVLYDGTATTPGYYVFKLNKSTQAWTRTSTALDDRGSSHADVLFDGTKLYVLSHIFSEVALVGATNQVELRRLSYSGGNWTVDTGFAPKNVVRARPEAMTLAKDGTGRLWVTWVEGAAVKYVTSADGTTWSAAATLPGTAATSAAVTTDDISTVVAFNGKVGIMWSAQQPNGFGTTSFYLATHTDGAAPNAWTTEIAATGASLADDHVSLTATPDGTLRAAVKTSRPNGTDDIVRLLTRTPAGAWSGTPVWQESSGVTNPVLVIDSTHNRAIVFATSQDGGGDILRKTSPLSSPSFPAGTGEVAIDDPTAGSVVNHVTASKAAVTSATGLVVLASDDADRTYWHHWDPLTS
jgi:hypothetical protein